MTAVDHAELKWFEPEVTGVQSRYVIVHQLRASADIQDTQTKRETGWATTSDRASLMREAARALEALLSEIEGLKAERDAWKKAVAAAQNADAENDAHLRSLLRTQAPDSWRPDRCDVEETIHAWLRDHAGNAIKMTMTPTIRDALADAILALRPQTAESGK